MKIKNVFLMQTDSSWMVRNKRGRNVWGREIELRFLDPSVIKGFQGARSV
jgi:hypothetical protein